MMGDGSSVVISASNVSVCIKLRGEVDQDGLEDDEEDAVEHENKDKYEDEDENDMDDEGGGEDGDEDGELGQTWCLQHRKLHCQFLPIGGMCPTRTLQHLVLMQNIKSEKVNMAKM